MKVGVMHIIIYDNVVSSRQSINRIELTEEASERFVKVDA
jgi:hypothetical protein